MAEGFEKFIKFGNTDDNGEVFGDNGGRNKGTNPNEFFSPDDGIVTPDLGPKKAVGGKPVVVVIDDDYSTLDLVKIYLQRDYDCHTFSNPKDAIFFVNQVLPSVIFIDCYMTILKTQQILDIILSYKETKDVPIYYLVNEEEKKVFQSKTNPHIKGCLTRPIARGELQGILDSLKLNAEEEANEDSVKQKKSYESIDIDEPSSISFDDEEDEDKTVNEPAKKPTATFSFDDDEDDDDEDKGFGVFD